jgi:phosphoglycerol geranylgeranyltransferase
MKKLYQDILECVSQKKKLLAVLIDPDKMTIEMAFGFIENVNKSIVTHIFIGGSSVVDNAMEKLVAEIKRCTHLPVILFPGDVNQITNKADALLYLSLISGRHPDYLIGKHVESVSILRKSNLEIIPTGYILIENGKETSVQKVTDSLPMSRHNIQAISDTAKAGELLGLKLIYLEAGSGAKHPVSEEIISVVKQDLGIPLIVGGGIKSKEQLDKAYNAGADMLVIGTAFEEDETFFSKL